MVGSEMFCLLPSHAALVACGRTRLLESRADIAFIGLTLRAS